MTQSFHPPVRTLMGPGPSDVNPRILEAVSRGLPALAGDGDQEVELFLISTRLSKMQEGE